MAFEFGMFHEFQRTAGVTDEEALQTWAESDLNFRFYCVKHHRSSQAGAHALSHSDFEASCYVPALTA